MGASLWDTLGLYSAATPNREYFQKTHPTDSVEVSEAEWILNTSGIKTLGPKVHLKPKSPMSKTLTVLETHRNPPIHDGCPCLWHPRAGKQHKETGRRVLMRTPQSSERTLKASTEGKHHKKGNKPNYKSKPPDSLKTSDSVKHKSHCVRKYRWLSLTLAS